MNYAEDHDTAELHLDEAKTPRRFFAPSPAAVKVRFGARSDPGKIRPNNEDQWLVVRRRRTRDVLLTSLPEGWLPTREEYAYATFVADGMGGAAFGEVASLLALRTGFELGLSEIHWPMKGGEEEAREVLEKFEVYGELIHKALLQSAVDDPKLAGMGTTLTIAYTIGLDAFIGYVGDSRAYLFHDNSIKQLTRDQTLAQQLLDRGVLAPDSIELRRFRNVLVNCLGGSHQQVKVEVEQQRLSYGDSLLLCTDGLSDLVSDEEIAATMRENPIPLDASNVLLNLALEKGGHDNITVVIAKYDKPEQSDEDQPPLIRG